MDDEIRRREAERQGRDAYARGLDRNPRWGIDMLAAFDRAEAEDRDDIVAPRRPREQEAPTITIVDPARPFVMVGPGQESVDLSADEIARFIAEVESLMVENKALSDSCKAVVKNYDTLTARVAELETENASLASWQCAFTDGKTGLVYSEGGGTYCAMARRVAELEEVLQRTVMYVQHTSVFDTVVAVLNPKNAALQPAPEKGKE